MNEQITMNKLFAMHYNSIIHLHHTAHLFAKNHEAHPYTAGSDSL